jgi:hypothetical protein
MAEQVSMKGHLLRLDANMADHVKGYAPKAGALLLQGKLRLVPSLCITTWYSGQM